MFPWFILKENCCHHSPWWPAGRSRGTMRRVCCILVVFYENPGTELRFPRGGRVPQWHWLRWSAFLPPFYGGKGHWIGSNWLSFSWPVDLSCKVTSHTTSNWTTANVPSCFICSVLYTYTPHTDTKHIAHTHHTHPHVIHAEQELRLNELAFFHTPSKRYDGKCDFWKTI